MKNKLLIVLVLLSIILIGASIVSAKSSYLYAFNQHYNTGDTVLDTCDVCHSGPNGGSLDSYGRAYSQTRSFAVIEEQDSDGDGFTNLEEINALRFPGDSSDYPQIESTNAENTTEEVTELVVNETTTVSVEETTTNETWEQETSEIGNEESTETTENTTGNQQSPGFETMIAVFGIIVAFYVKR
ncbi:hypothetical protein [Methanolobus vulcani]|uniref:Uncharacterized protein n=1 Tax=Methanolobus vulcani TaxID=38026 RepID=A0A7Z8P4U6_9EURY|nr:hypothetical protein [Methanolobus vulcani]TQD25874.1 hypothetical protein FKV42_06790 [Methanolobus vulcani]